MVLENQTSLSTNVEEIDSEFAGIIVMLDELCGEYADELKNSIGSIVTEAKIICDTIINGLENTLGEVQNLSDNLGTFKEDDETCEEKLDELKSTKAKLETSTAQDTIKNIKNKIFNIQNAIKSYKKLLEKDRD